MLVPRLFRDGAWCKHVAALGYVLISRCAQDPFYPFKLRCFDVVSMLPRKRVAPGSSEVICLESDDDADGAGEEGSSRDHAIDLTA